MDEASIRNTIARFADSATRFDTDMFRTLWADDAEFIIGHAPHGQSATGVDDIVAMLRRLRAERDFFVQFALPASSRSTVTKQPRVPSVTRLRAGLAKLTTGITLSPPIGCSARVTSGCSQAVPSNICGSTLPRSRAMRSRCFPRWPRPRHNPVGRQVSAAN